MNTLKKITEINTSGELCSVWIISQQNSFICIEKVVKGLAVQSCLTLCDPVDCSLPGSSVHGTFPLKNTGVGCHFLLQGLFPTQGSNPGLPHCRQILYQLSHNRSPRILEWVAYPFSSRSSQPRNWTSLLHCRRILYQLSYEGSPKLTPIT